MAARKKQYQYVHQFIEELMQKIQCPPQGLFKYPSLSTTSGSAYSGGIFCWDSHHMTLRFAADGHPEYMKYFLLTMLQFQYPNGYVPSFCGAQTGGCNLENFHAQPFLAQNLAIYYSITEDRETLLKAYEPLVRYLDYWCQSAGAALGLYRWSLPWMSGFDNEITGTIYPPDSVITPDLPSLLYLEFRAMEYLAGKAGKSPKKYQSLAKNVHRATNRFLWDEEYGIYTAYNLASGKTLPGLESKNDPSGFGYSFISCPSLLTLFAGIASQERAERMIRTYVLSPNHFRSKYGIRSLSKMSPYYNNAKIGNPPRYGDPHKMTNSNWQGPVWIPLIWFTFHGLLRYGFQQEAKQLAEDAVSLIAKSLDMLGFMRESYDAETGEGTYADNFASWNILTDIMPLFFSKKPPLSIFPWENP